MSNSELECTLRYLQDQPIDNVGEVIKELTELVSSDNYHITISGEEVAEALEDDMEYTLSLYLESGSLYGKCFDDYKVNKELGGKIPFSCVNIYSKVL